MADYEKKYKDLDSNRDGKITQEELSQAAMTGNGTLLKEYLNDPDPSKRSGGKSSTPTTGFQSGRNVEGSGNYSATDISNSKAAGYDPATMDTDGSLKYVEPKTGTVTELLYIASRNDSQPEYKNFLDGIKHLKDTYGKQLWTMIKDAVPNLGGVAGDAVQENALLTLARNYAIYNFNAVGMAPNLSHQGSLTFKDFLQRYKNGLIEDPEVTTKSFTNYTGRKTAFDSFKTTVQDLLGIDPTKQDFEKFYKELNSKERSYVTTQTSGKSFATTKEEQLSVERFTLEYIVKNMLETKKDLRGSAGQIQNQIGQLSKQYGLEDKLPVNTTVKFLKGMLLGKNKEADIMDAMRKRAKVAYGAFAEDLDDNPDMTLAEIMDQYIGTYSNTLEVGSNELSISDVAKFATGKDNKKLGLWDFQKQLRADKRFSYTKQANQEAANLALSFAKAFGVNL
jgi:hypothetical protein